MIKSYTIYALICPNTKVVRYIGYTSKSLEIRLRYHYYDISKGVMSHKVSFLKSILPLRAEIIPIEENIPTLDDALVREVYWITQYSNLINSTTGGESNKVYMPEVVKKMSDNRKGKCAGIDNPMFGKKRPDLSLRNKNANPESAKKGGETLRIKYLTPEYKKIHQQSQKNLVMLISIDKDGKEIVYNSAREAGRDGFDRKSITNCLNGVQKQHKGFIWKVA